MPQKVQVPGPGEFYQPEELEAIQEAQAAGKTLLTDKSIKKSQHELSGSIRSKKAKSLKPLSETNARGSALSATKAMAKLSGDELNFLNDYKRIEELEKQKGIKFFECIGDPPIEQAFEDRLAVKRQNFIDEGLEKMRGADVERFMTEVNADKVVVPVKNELTSQPRWDVYSNSHFAMRKRMAEVLLKNANKMIIRLRAAKRLAKITAWLREHNITSRADCRRAVADDYRVAMNAQVTSDDKDGDAGGIETVRYQFSFGKKQLLPDVRLAMEYEGNVASVMEKIDTQPVVSFDDLNHFDAIEQLDFEVEAYKEFPIPAISPYEPVFEAKRNRPGCEYESALRARAGEPDLEKLQQDAHVQMEMLKQSTKDVVSGANIAPPSSFTKPFDFSVDLLVRSHPTLRKYLKQVKVKETEPEYVLDPSGRPPLVRAQPKDEIELCNVRKTDPNDNTLKNTTKSMAGAFVNQTDVPAYDLPGNFGVRALGTMPTDQR